MLNGCIEWVYSSTPPTGISKREAGVSALHHWCCLDLRWLFDRYASAVAFRWLLDVQHLTISRRREFTMDFDPRSD